MDTWIESVAQGRTNVAPKNIPWEIIRLLVTEMYGGKIDDADDFQALRALVEKFLTPAAFEDGYRLVDIHDSDTTEEYDQTLNLPSSTGLQDFLGWVNALPEREPPTYLGLPSNAEKLLLVEQARGMIENLKTVMQMLDEGEQVMAEVEES